MIIENYIVIRFKTFDPLHNMAIKLWINYQNLYYVFKTQPLRPQLGIVSPWSLSPLLLLCSALALAISFHWPLKFWQSKSPVSYVYFQISVCVYMYTYIYTHIHTYMHVYPPSLFFFWRTMEAYILFCTSLFFFPLNLSWRFFHVSK